jgi:uncharacterized membrane protein YhhN
MTGVSLLLLALGAVAAVADWFAVGYEHRWLEYIAKPLTLVALVLAAARLDVHDEAAQSAVVVALVLSLVGDVLLMLPGDALFVFGLGAFLLAHVAYVVAFWIIGVSAGAFLVGLLVVAAAIVVLGRRIIRGVASGPHSSLVGPVAVYIGMISLMVASAVGTTDSLAIAGAVLFYASDALIAWTRFIEDLRGGRVAIMVTYHVAQLLLVLSLVTA